MLTLTKCRKRLKIEQNFFTFNQAFRDQRKYSLEKEMSTSSFGQEFEWEI